LPAPSGGREASVLYFFLSYAREDDPTCVRRFFDDLSRNVRDLAGVDRNDQVGFLDSHSIEPGRRWAGNISEALSACSCFVALTSPRYFRREYCGREWSVFRSRIAMYERRWSRAAPSLLTVQWIPTPIPHPVAQEVQWVGADLPRSRDYEEYGLRQIQFLKRFRDDYRAFVFRLARHIVATAGTHFVPRLREPFDLDAVPNVFATTPPGPPLVYPVATPRTGGRRAARPRYVHFVVVAGSRREMASRRQNMELYGHDRVDWAPYWPAVDGSLGGHASQIADDRFFDCEVADVGNLRERIDSARRRFEIVVLFIDAWSLEMEEHRRAVVQYDQSRDPATAVMVPFSSTDLETVRDTTVLQGRLARVLPKTLRRRDRIMMRQNVPTHDDFSADLSEILEVAQNRLYRSGRRSGRPRPMLGGPGSMDGPGE
jgi:FxsC-like protein